MAAAPETETLNISDGTTITMARVPGVDDATWAEVRTYLEGNPEVAKSLQKFAKNPDAMRGWLQTQAIAEHYQKKMKEEGDSGATAERVKALEQDPELAPIFEEIKKNGLEAAMKHCENEEPMLKVSQKMGGVPQDLQGTLTKIEEASLSVHEAAKNGDLKAVQEYMAKGQPLDAQDHKGITPLGYAIGANKIAVVKLLLDKRANAYAVDATGNSGLHYAAGYGRKELLEYLLKTGMTVSQANSQGQTPLTVATQNRQEACIQVLKAHGAA